MTNRLNLKRSTLIAIVATALSMGLLAGCGSGNNDSDQATSDPETTQPADPNATGTDPNATGTDPNATGTDPNATGTDAAATQTTPSGESNTGTAGNVQGKDVACNTPNQIAQVSWQNGEPRLSLVRKPNQSLLNQATPVAIQRNPDDSVTYGYFQDVTAYVRTFPNGNCLVQTLDAQGSVQQEGYGRTS